MRDDDIFAGRVDVRLERADRLVRAAVLDAQCRDWTAERPDRVGFARLGQVHHRLEEAILRYTRFPPVEDGVVPLVAIGTWLATAVLALLLAPDPAAPVTLAGALVAGLITAQAAVTVRNRVQGRRARRAATGPAPIDDPYLFAELTRRIEACAATARSGPEPRRIVADDLEQAQFWISSVLP